MPLVGNGELLRGKTDFGSDNRGRSAVLEVERRAVPATSGSDTLPTTVGPGLGLGAGQATAVGGGSVAAGGAGLTATVSLAVPLLGHLLKYRNSAETFRMAERHSWSGWNSSRILLNWLGGMTTGNSSISLPICAGLPQPSIGHAV